MKMKINIIFPEFGLSGGVMVALRYANALTSFGHDVMCYAKKTPYFFPKTVKDAAHYVHRLVSDYDAEIAKRKCGEFAFRTPLVINDRTIRDADVVIATAWCTAYDAARLSEVKGRKFYFIQDYEIWDDEQKGIQSYRLPLKHIVIAGWIEDILVGKLGCKKGVIAHNGVDLQEFRPDHSIRKEKITILMMYHLLPKKGISDGLKVLDEIHKAYPDIRISMFGKPTFNDKPDYIEYYRDPEPADLVRLYQQSDIFLFPAREEGWGLTVVEAMACGCAVAGTKAGCLLEIGIDKINVLLSEPGDTDALCRNVKQLIENKQLRDGIANNSLKTVESLSWTESYKKFEKALMDRT